jgi:hypothetical protein
MDQIANKVQILEIHLVQNGKTLEELGKKVSMIQEKIEEKEKKCKKRRWCNVL